MPMNRRRAAAVVAALALVAGHAAAAGTGPFGVGLPEPAATGGGFLPGLFRAVAYWQSGFYRELTATLRAMKSDGTAGLWLAGLSFLYGILHAVGPGHGKAVISAYVLANRETALNGAKLAVVSALAQAVSAVALVSVAAVVLGATSIAMTEAAALFEVGSFLLISTLGVWLVVRKVAAPLAAAYRERYAPVVVGAFPAGPAVELVVGGSAVQCRHDRFRGLGDRGADCGCGHAHLPAPEALVGPLDWRRAASAVAAVGFRPCTGALIVLVFALSQGIYAAGIMATFAMALGTGLTVAALTLTAIGARGLALRLASGGGGAWTATAHRAIEGAAAVVILLFGLTMLAASLYGL